MYVNTSLVTASSAVDSQILGRNVGGTTTTRVVTSACDEASLLERQVLKEIRVVCRGLGAAVKAFLEDQPSMPIRFPLDQDERMNDILSSLELLNKLVETSKTTVRSIADDSMIIPKEVPKQSFKQYALETLKTTAKSVADGSMMPKEVPKQTFKDTLEATFTSSLKTVLGHEPSALVSSSQSRKLESRLARAEMSWTKRLKTSAETTNQFVELPLDAVIDFFERTIRPKLNASNPAYCTYFGSFQSKTQDEIKTRLCDLFDSHDGGRNVAVWECELSSNDPPKCWLCQEPFTPTDSENKCQVAMARTCQPPGADRLFENKLVCLKATHIYHPKCAAALLWLGPHTITTRTLTGKPGCLACLCERL